VVGGLVVSTALTLMIVPVVYSLIPGRARERAAGESEGEEGEREERPRDEITAVVPPPEPI
jgi:hypothetical protein